MLGHCLAHTKPWGLSPVPPTKEKSSTCAEERNVALERNHRLWPVELKARASEEEVVSVRWTVSQGSSSGGSFLITCTENLTTQLREYERTLR